jgi:hypothetical protein
MTPEELTDAFMAWIEEEDLLGRLDRDEVEIMALAFGAGARYAIKVLN